MNDLILMEGSCKKQGADARGETEMMKFAQVKTNIQSWPKHMELKMIALFILYEHAIPFATAAVVFVVIAWAMLTGLSDEIGNSIAIANQ